MSKIPKKPRIKYVIEMAYKFILDNNITSYPINLTALIKKNKWHLEKYSYFESIYNITNEEVCLYFNSSDAKTYFTKDKCTEFYAIVFNDNYELNTVERIRFTLAHEIGHIYLNHLKDFEETNLYRNGLSFKDYSILEKEADVFACNILCPYPIIKNILENLKYKKEHIEIISNIFKISRSAAKTRLGTIYQVKSHNFNKFHKFDKIKILIYEHLKNKYIDIMEVSNIAMIYKGFIQTECKVCKNVEMIENSQFCNICGNDLRNTCVNSDCINNNESLSNSSRFCNLCGSKSKFYLENKLICWSEVNNTPYDYNDDCDDDNLPF